MITHEITDDETHNKVFILTNDLLSFLKEEIEKRGPYKENEFSIFTNVLLSTLSHGVFFNLPKHMHTEFIKAFIYQLQLSLDYLEKNERQA